MFVHDYYPIRVVTLVRNTIVVLMMKSEGSRYSKTEKYSLLIFRLARTIFGSVLTKYDSLQGLDIDIQVDIGTQI